MACPQQLAVAGVEPQEIAVGCAPDGVPARERYAAVHGPELIVSRLPRVAPAGTAGRGVDRDRLADSRQVHHAAVHEGARLEGLARADLKDAGDGEYKDKKSDRAMLGIHRNPPLCVNLSRAAQNINDGEVDWFAIF